MKVVIAGGGTAGHIFPALALAQRLSEEHDASVTFIGTDRGLERNLVPAAGYELVKIDAKPFLRKVSVQTLQAPVALLRSVSQCRPTVDAADVVVGMGGYASGPAVVAARRGDKPVVVHEQNAVPGAANKLASRWARVVCLSFAEARDGFAGRVNTVVTGNPVRRDVLDLPDRRDALRAEAMETFGLDPGRTTIVVFGGSQGALHLNDAAAAAWTSEGLAERGDLQLLLLSGATHGDRMRAALAGAPSATVLPFLDRMELAYAAADLVVCRSGATTMAEITVCGLPSILVPYPHATANHQEANARSLEKAGGARVLLDPDMTGASLGRAIGSLVDDDTSLAELGRGATAWAKPEAARALGDIVVAESDR